MAELMFQCSLFLVFLISSLFRKSYWLCICCRDLILHVDPKEEKSFIQILRIYLNVCLITVPDVVQLSEVMSMELSSPWVFSFIFVMGRNPVIYYTFFFFFFLRKLRCRLTKLAVSVRIKQDTQNKWSLGCLSKSPPPDQILFILRTNYFFAGKSCSFVMNPMNFHW